MNKKKKIVTVRGHRPHTPLVGGPPRGGTAIKPVAVEVDGETLYTKNLSCPVCGEPLTHADKYGMMCDKECEKTENKVNGEYMDKMLKDLFGPDAPKSFRIA